MTRRLHIERAEEYEAWAAVTVTRTYPEWIAGEWHDVTDDLMALYHYFLAYAPKGTHVC